MLVRYAAVQIAEAGDAFAPVVKVRLLKIVRPIASAATVLLLVAVGVRYFEGFVGAVGSYAIAAQLIYAVGLLLGTHALAAGMPAGQRSVLSLGACSHNLGAALAPLRYSAQQGRRIATEGQAVLAEPDRG